MPPQKPTALSHEVRRKQNCGFALISFLIFMQAFVIIFIKLQQLGRQHVKSTKLHSACEKQLLQYQHQQSELLNQLMRLNPKVANLRTKRKIAKLELYAATASGNAHRIYRAEMKLIKIEQKLNLIKMQQNEILKKSALNQKAQKYSFTKAFYPHKPARLQIPDLAVAADRLDEITPIYIEKPNFESAQLAHCHIPTSELDVTCSATITKRNRFYRGELRGL